jgi:hypothetical protein
MMRALTVVLVDPHVKIDLQLVYRGIDLLAEDYLVELVQDRLVEPLANAVGLWRLRFGFGAINVVHSSIELVIVLLYLAAKLRGPISQDAQRWHRL